MIAITSAEEKTMLLWEYGTIQEVKHGTINQKWQWSKITKHTVKTSFMSEKWSQSQR